MDGARHLDELQARLRETVMVRRRKADVLTELPPKRRQVIALKPATGAERQAVKAEQAAWNAHEEKLTAARATVEMSKASSDPEDYKRAVAAYRDASSVAFSEISRARKETAVAKAPQVLEHVTSVLDEDPDRKVVIFAHHHDVVRELSHGLACKHVVLTGETPTDMRTGLVDTFQNDPQCRVFLGSIGAAGVGLTLTASAHVVFAELDWVPANLTQAEDRCHRIGQKDHVLVQHVILEGSLDERMASLLVEKQRIADAALDREGAEPADVHIPALPSENGNGSTRKALEEAAETLTANDCETIHQALRSLAGMCDGARDRDGSGFNKFDAALGHRLANEPGLTPLQAALGHKLVKRYKRQLGDIRLEGGA